MLDSKFVGIGRVGGTLFRNVVESPFIKMNKEDAYDFSYFDVNSSIKQYETINKQNVVVHRLSMNNIGGDEIDFTPPEAGFTRIVVGKDSDDTFFVSYVPSKKMVLMVVVRYIVSWRKRKILLRLNQFGKIIEIAK